jgi:hypothetical protein
MNVLTTWQQYPFLNGKNQKYMKTNTDTIKKTLDQPRMLLYF